MAGGHGHGRRRPGGFHAVVLVVGSLVVGAAEALTFTSPTATTLFSSTLANTITFTADPTDPAVIDIYLYSTSTALPLGPTRLRLLASSVSPSLGALTFTAGGVAVLPPGQGYAVVAVPQGQTQAIGISDTFDVVEGDPTAAMASMTALTQTTTIGLSTIPATATDVPDSTANPGVVGTPFATTSTSVAFNISPSAGRKNTALTQTTTLAFSTTYKMPQPTITGAVAPGGSAEQGLHKSAAPARAAVGWSALVAAGAAMAAVLWS